MTAKKIQRDMTVDEAIGEWLLMCNDHYDDMTRFSVNILINCIISLSATPASKTYIPCSTVPANTPCLRAFFPLTR